MASGTHSEEGLLEALQRYMTAVDQHKQVCHPGFVARLIQLENFLKPSTSVVLPSGHRWIPLLNFLARHTRHVLDGSSRDPTLACFLQPGLAMYRAHPHISIICGVKCQEPRGHHRELATERTGVSVMLDILARFNHVDTVLHNAASAPSASYFNLIIVWLKHKSDAIAPSLFGYPNLASSPAVLLALIDAVAKYAAGNAMNQVVLFGVAPYVAQCGGPSQGGAWHNYLLRLSPQQAMAFVRNCTVILDWMDVHREWAQPQIDRFRGDLVETSGNLVAVRQLPVNEVGCHRHIRRRAFGGA
ncbi:hypothetical protein EV715DRAFT_287388 [Schizophyllum commune]